MAQRDPAPRRVAQTQKQNSFFGGAAILAAGILIVKLIGMFYKIPLINIIGEAGAADFNNAYNIYAVLLTVSTAGLPVAVSKLVSEANALDRRNQVRRTFRLALVLFLALWELCTRLDMVDDFIFSSPSRVFFCFRKMVLDGSIFSHIGITLFETIVSFLIVTIIGISAAVLLWSSRSASEILEPYLVMLNSLPKSALAPMLIVWMGSHVHTIIAAAVSVAVFGSILTLQSGFSSMDPDQIRLIYTLGGTKKDVLTKVLLPGSVPLILSNMKVNVGLCLVGVIIGEFIGARQGLGYLIIYGSQTFQQVCILKLFPCSILHISSFTLLFPVTAAFSFLSTSYNETFSDFPSKKKIFF